MAATVPAGAVIERSDLVSVEVAGVPDAISVGDVDQVVGSTAAVGLVRGEVLSPGMLTSTPVPGPGQRVVGVQLDATRTPAGLAPGDVVEILAVPPTGDASSPNALSSPVVLADAARVVSTSRAPDGGARLTLLIPETTTASPETSSTGSNSKSNDDTDTDTGTGTGTYGQDGVNVADRVAAYGAAGRIAVIQAPVGSDH